MISGIVDDDDPLRRRPPSQRTRSVAERVERLRHGRIIASPGSLRGSPRTSCAAPDSVGRAHFSPRPTGQHFHQLRERSPVGAGDRHLVLGREEADREPAAGDADECEAAASPSDDGTKREADSSEPTMSSTRSAPSACERQYLIGRAFAARHDVRRADVAHHGQRRGGRGRSRSQSSVVHAARSCTAICPSPPAPMTTANGSRARATATSA